MRGILIGLTWGFITLLASAQTRDQDAARCSGNDPDLILIGCTALIQSGRETPADLVIDYANRGGGYFLKDRYEQAIADENKAITLNPDYPEAYMNRGAVYNTKGLYDLAIADFTKAIELKPMHHQAALYFNRGLAFAHKRLNERAIADYRAALKIDPTMQLARDQLKRLSAAP